ncbi:glyceraldehyde-3-phosphate dehydrogenase 2 [Pullulanibacillus camelliae]|uniref:Glyceraldehyde-3-phosphate dehydrogenase 2 n=1 Tax=Pullulanibacillus camelliae TaxID=1707096 RepID=A0A8J2YME8_9BACL|nr:type I glyceraldehyde-3-phosphate dehydrogenase [Pullulanibacillus camelliae]GGE53012.1 glyceraldehyde-3-phosphate dehydrogenase 2 [Pullulanibacillus camelliae]
MGKRMGISGMGRIGRLLVRKMMTDTKTKDMLKAINSLYPAETIAHLLKYDSVHGRWDAEIVAAGEMLYIDGRIIKVTYCRDPETIPWQQLEIDLVIDATGKFNNREGMTKHIKAGASSVLITAPGEDVDLTAVMGINHQDYDPEKHTFLSAASCTTNCVVPLLKMLDDECQIKQGWVTTIHALTSDQNHMDNPHEDLRRARSCTQSIIPTTTGIGKALKAILPHLAPSIEGTAVRVPIHDVSLTDLTVEVSKNKCTVDSIKKIFSDAIEERYSHIVEMSNEPLVSKDYIGNDKSAVVDGASIMVKGNQIKVLAWYDNEWAYSCRVAELAHYLLERRRTHGKLQRTS